MLYIEIDLTDEQIANLEEYYAAEGGINKRLCDFCAVALESFQETELNKWLADQRSWAAAAESLAAALYEIASAE